MIILGTNSIKDTGYDVANSCRFDGSSAYLRKTFSGTSTDSNKCTMSFWCKKSSNGANLTLLTANIGGSSNRDRLYFDADDKLQFFLNNANNGNLLTNRLFRDNSAWYHICVAIDTTQGTAANRVKIYINGTQETSFSTESYPAEDYALTGFGHSVEHTIGADDSDGGSNEYYNGYMAEVAFVNGVAHAVTDFGKFDSDSPTIWKPKDVSGLTFGTNGFYLDFEDSSSLGNDAAGSNNFTATNLAATDQATDTPTNNFATWNPLFGASNLSYAEGNAEISCSADGWFESGATIGISTGKWYFELKCTLGSGTYSSESIKFGTCDASRINDGSGEIQRAENHYQADGNSVNDDTISGVGTFPTFTTGDIVGCAVDMTNRKIYYHKNGTYINSGNPSSGSNGFDISSSFDFVLPAISMYESGTKGEVNFGNPSFSISSGNADADGYGNFEYSVPSGFYALCTKNLAEYG